MEGVGRFGWVTDPEGNRHELWQPRLTAAVWTGKDRPDDSDMVPDLEPRGAGHWW
jgi:hypothetical protein